MHHTDQSPRWMRWVLYIAAFYNLIYAIALSLWPTELFVWLQMPDTPAVMIQCIGMMVGVYALGYWFAAQDPIKNWGHIAVGLLGKTLGPIGFIHGIYTGTFVWHSGLMLLANDLIWWIPFWWMLWHVYRLRHR